MSQRAEGRRGVGKLKTKAHKLLADTPVHEGVYLLALQDHGVSLELGVIQFGP